MMCAKSVREIICQRGFSTMNDAGNVADMDKKRGPATYVQNGMSPCAFVMDSRVFSLTCPLGSLEPELRAILFQRNPRSEV
ncbi:hypothetical protein TNCV_603631 [Trichonephila clavipes]|nr:hypothetical protein TNCV_603631 [Trichonephila clavipes]